MKYSKLATIDKFKKQLKNKVVFLRLDLNVPMKHTMVKTKDEQKLVSEITSYKRINESLPTIKYLLENKAKVVILSHLGRPKTKEDIKSGEFSLEVPAKALAERIFPYAKKCTFISVNKGPVLENEIDKMESGEVLILENTRFNDVDLKTNKFIGLESNCDLELAKYWAELCDVFVNDAFGVAHRKHASTYGIGNFTRNSAIGFLMVKELKTLSSIIDVKPEHKPFVVIFGGAKVSDKIKAVKSVLKVADKVIISGGMAYTFVAAQGFNIGNSMVEPTMFDEVKEIMKVYADKISISCDFLCANKFANDKPTYRTQEEGMKGKIGLDIGEKSIKQFQKIIAEANSVLWNGPMGVTEFSNYETGTNEICKAIAKRTKNGAFTIIGGGDSAAAAEKLKKEDSFSFISTGGGASLRLIEGSTLEGIASIKKRGLF